MTPQLAEIIIKFLNRADIKGHESELLSQCKAAVAQLAKDAQGQAEVPEDPSDD